MNLFEPANILIPKGVDTDLSPVEAKAEALV